VARMWRDRERYPEHNNVPDTFWLLGRVSRIASGPVGSGP
jgi:hypothetical protein